MLDYGHYRQSDFENKIVVLGYVTIGFDERKTCNIQRVKGETKYYHAIRITSGKNEKGFTITRD